MAEAKKRKLEKVTDARLELNENPARFYCYTCGRSFSRRKGFFPVSHSPTFRAIGYLPFCNECVEEEYERLRHEYAGDDRMAMKRMCMKMDIYWNDSIYDMVERTAGVTSRIRNYIGKTNLTRYMDKTYADTIKEESLLQKNGGFTLSTNVSVDTQVEEAEPEVQVEQEIIDFWGEGFSADYYYALEKQYKDWTGGVEVEDPGARSLYKQICLLEVAIARDAAQGKSFEKNVNALNTLIGSMNLKPAQKKSDSDAELEKMPLGVGIQKWEYYRPLPATPNEQKDTNGLIKNITTWFLGHACKMVGLKNSYCSMYENAMAELRVEHPEYDDEDDDLMLNDIFNSSPTNVGGDDG